MISKAVQPMFVLAPDPRSPFKDESRMPAARQPKTYVLQLTPELSSSKTSFPYPLATSALFLGVS